MNSLLEIFDEKLLPWARDFERQRLVGTGGAWRKSELPEGVRVTRKLPRGPREITKGGHSRSNPDMTTAKWPRDGLMEVAGAPMIVCVLSGRIDYWAGDIVVHCGEGYFLLLPPGTRQDDGSKPHYDHKPGSDDFCDLLWIQRMGRIMRTWTCHSRGRLHGAESGTQADFLSDTANTMLDSLMAEAVGGQEGWRSVCGHCLCSLLTVLRRELQLGTTLISSRQIETESRASPEGDPIQQAQTYIRTHLRDKLTIDKVAQHLYMSRAQFTKIFRQQTGMTFTEYLTACRIEESKTLLSDSSWGIQRISRIIGLRSASYFCELFARHVGVSPQTFRNQRGG